ncbi:MAG: hypothetical protein Q8S17_14415 [Humidesulfovibrio sp.]|nr:hypothetical protein [Humidesulfovibrio sp.]
MRPNPEGLARAESLGEKVIAYQEGLPQAQGVGALVIDLPYAPEQDLLALAQREGWQVVVVDDLGRDLCFCDVVLNSSVLASPEAYPRARRTLLGPENLILDQSFRQARHAGSGRTPATVLLTFGGSDPTGLTGQALAAMELVEAPCHLEVVLGPGFGDAREIMALAGSCKRSECVVKVAPAVMLPSFTGCDLAVCAGGRTMYELRHLGTPTVAVASSSAEAKAVAAFVAKGYVLFGMEKFEPARFAGIVSSALGRVAAGEAVGR